MHPRQFQSPSGAVTAVLPTVTPVGSLSLDASATDSSGLVPPTLTVSSTDILPSPTQTPNKSVAPSKQNNTKISTGAIVGLTIGIFLALAIALVTFMTIRHKKRIQATRARSKAKAAAAPTGKEPTQLQMRSVNPISIADSNARTAAGESFLSMNSTQARMWEQTPGKQSPTSQLTPTSGGDPFLDAQPVITHMRLAPTPGPEESFIPNPFDSSPSSSSHSSNGSTASAATITPSGLQPKFHPAQLGHTTELAHTSAMTVSTVSDYPFEYPPSPRRSHSTELSDAMEGRASPQAEPNSEVTDKDAHERELKAMQNLISALDERSGHSAPPSSFGLKLNTAGTTSSRLSMGEGLVTPGGHSIREEDAASMHAANTPKIDLTFKDTSLPPTEVFRAALAHADIKGKGKAINPFDD
ncbi:hypothetical protein K439DRAFT_1612842 [Ramaria rubella]|nr:hypothetical protein K439DRAFT_1612842 [Ramaria rubella]